MMNVYVHSLNHHRIRPSCEIPEARVNVCVCVCVLPDSVHTHTGPGLINMKQPISDFVEEQRKQ